MAWIAAERSLPAAQSAELPLLLAASAYHLGHVFLRAGQVEEATSVAMTAARALSPGWRPPIRSTCRHGARCI